MSVVHIPDTPSLRSRLRAGLSIGGLNACWEWKGSTKMGYGVIGHGDKKTYLVHRVAYTLYKRPIPEGLTLDHLCRNTLCANPRHLEPVTQRENVLRGNSLSAQRARQTHCSNGHEFTDENTYINPISGSRTCRVCIKEYRQRRWRERRA